MKASHLVETEVYDSVVARGAWSWGRGSFRLGVLALGAVLAACGGGSAARDAAPPTAGASGGAAGASGGIAGASGGATGAAGAAPSDDGGAGRGAGGAPDGGPDGSASDAADAPAPADAPAGDVAVPDAGALRQPTYPGVVLSPVDEVLQVADFHLAPDEKTVAATNNPLIIQACDSTYINLLHSDGTRFLLARDVGKAALWRSSSFTEDGGFFAAIESQGVSCTLPDYFLSMNTDGTGKVARLAVTSGARQSLVGLYGRTALSLDWKPPASTTAPDTYVLRDLSRPGGPTPVAFGKFWPVPDPSGTVVVWGASGGEVLSPIDKSNPVALSPGEISCDHVWAPDGKTLAFRWGGNCVQTEGTLSLIDRDGTRLRAAGTKTLPAPNPVFSADGQRLAWSAHGDAGQRTIVIGGIAGQTPVVVPAPPATTDQAFDLAMMWFSPSGKWLVVEVESNAFIVSATGGGAFKRAGAPYGTFSADETVYGSWGTQAAGTTYLATTGDASEPRVLSASSRFAPVFARNGAARMLTSERVDSVAGDMDLVLSDIDGGNRQIVARVPASQPQTKLYLRAHGWTTPRWLGNAFVYAGPIIPNTSDLPYDLHAISPDGKTTGLVAPDVVAFDWVPRNPTTLFFIRRMPDGGKRLWRASPPAAP